MVHPKVPCILMTPLCPHSLSFRPMILPDSAQVKVVVPLESRYAAWASFDGKHRIELRQGDSILIRKSSLNMITVDPCAYPCSSLNWFKNLSKYLHWNVRARQKGRNNSEDRKILQKASISDHDGHDEHDWHADHDDADGHDWHDGHD